MGLRTVWMLRLLAGVCLLSCRDTDELPDHVSAVKDACLVDPSLLGSQEYIESAKNRIAPDECVSAMSKLVHFEESFDTYRGIFGDQKSRVFNALYVLLNYPTTVVFEEKVADIAPGEQFFPETFARWMKKYPGVPIHHLLFNYIIDSVKVFRLNDAYRTILKNFAAGESGGFYNPLDQSIYLKTRMLDGNDSFSTVLQDLLMLIHEVRHSSTMDHEVYCPEIWKGANQCDLGMDGPNGFQAAYLVGLLQGSADTIAKNRSIDQTAEKFARLMRRIYGLPVDWSGMRNGMYVRDRLVHEPLSVRDTIQLYLQVREMCPNGDRVPSRSCLQKLSFLLRGEKDPPPSSFALLGSILLVLQMPMPTDGLFLNHGTPAMFLEDLGGIVLDRKAWPYFRVRPSESIILSLFDKIKTAVASQGEEYRPPPFDPSYPLSTMGRIWLDWVQRAVVESAPSEQRPSPEIKERANRYSAIVLWSVLRGQKALPASDRTFTDQDLEIFTQLLCQHLSRLDAQRLPAAFQDVPSLSCDQIRAAL